MAKLIYTAITSLDGYIADEQGNFDWAAPDEEVHAFVNDLERPIGTYLYGRRLYEVMRYWAGADAEADRLPPVADFRRIWQAANKVVYSTSLREPLTDRTRVEHAFEPDAVRRMKTEAERDLSVGGAELAGQAIKAGLVDEIGLLLTPIVVGGGRRALPADVVVRLDLLDERRFESGVVLVRYRTLA